MTEDDFYASIKLKTGEEIFAKVFPTYEEDKTLLLLDNPIIISQYKNRSGMEGYKLEPWLKTTTEDLFVLNMQDVLTMTESKDVEMIMLHQQYIQKTSVYKPKKPNLSRRMGYISSVNDAKALLEKLYNNS